MIFYTSVCLEQATGATCNLPFMVPALELWDWHKQLGLKLVPWVSLTSLLRAKELCYHKTVITFKTIYLRKHPSDNLKQNSITIFLSKPSPQPTRPKHLSTAKPQHCAVEIDQPSMNVYWYPGLNGNYIWNYIIFVPKSGVEVSTNQN